MAHLLLVAVMLVPLPCLAGSSDTFLRAARVTRIPVELLLAISHVESGFHPRALNLSGQPYFPSTVQEAEAILNQSGDNVDIGLMQINWAFWGKKLRIDKAQLLDPRLNVMLGARILEHCLKSSGDWWQAVGMYHSPDKARQTQYAQKVRASYRRVVERLN